MGASFCTRHNTTRRKQNAMSTQEQHNIYQKQHNLDQQGAGPGGEYPDGRLTPAQVELPQVHPNELPAFASPDGDIRVIYKRDSMAVRYQKMVADLFTHYPDKAVILEKTMNGEFLAEDIRSISRAAAFLMDTLRAAQAGEYTYDSEYMTQTLYQYQDIFFPQAMQLLSGEGMDTQVTAQHKNRDPLLHTCEAMASLVETLIAFKDLDDQTISLEIIAIMLHDFGKLHNPKDISHPSGSIVWASEWITSIANQTAELVTNNNSPEDRNYFATEGAPVIERASRYSAEEAGYMLHFLIQFHDIAGFIDAGRLSMEDGMTLLLSDDYIPNMQALLSLKRIQDADMTAIPGMRQDFVAANRRILDMLMQKIATFRTQSGFEEELVPRENVRPMSDAEVKQLFATVAPATLTL